MECKEIDKNLVWVYTEFTLYKSTCISLLFETKESESFKVLQCQINDKITITITMLLCKELILIRGQPPRQGGSPRATLDRGEFT